MNKISRPLLIALAVVLVLVAVAMGLAVTHEHGGMDGTLMMFDNDLSDSAFGWAIAIPILLLVGVNRLISKHERVGSRAAMVDALAPPSRSKFESSLRRCPIKRNAVAEGTTSDGHQAHEVAQPSRLR